MKELRVGDVAVYTEDDDNWDDLVKVVRKANKAYLDGLDPAGQKKRQRFAQKLEKWVKKKLF